MTVDKSHLGNEAVASMEATHLPAEKNNSYFAGKRKALCVIASLISVCASSMACAETVQHFYQNKNIIILVGSAPGSGYDRYARLVADHLGKSIPGQPKVSIEYRAGSGGFVATQYLYARAARDGTVLAMLPETIGITQLLEPKIATWNVGKMTYLGSFSPVNVVFIVRKGANATTLEQMRGISTNVGTNGRNARTYHYASILKILGSYKLNLITGYQGYSDLTLALHRNEIDASAVSWGNVKEANANDVKNGEFVPLVQAGLSRIADLPDVPLMQEVLSTPREKSIIQFVSASSAIGYALLAPPNVPDDRSTALRNAVDALGQDPEFLQDAQRRHLDIQMTAGTKVQDYNNQIINTPKEVIDAAIQAIGGSSE